MKRSIWAILSVGMGVFVLGLNMDGRWLRADAAEPARSTVESVAAPALERARKQAKMLDTLYKTAIVLITEHYVKGEESLAAGDAFQALFKTMKDNGYHEVRLLDATGDPIDADNLPKGDAEKAAVQAMLDGRTLHEDVFTANGKNYLRSVTPIPVVMEKCLLCHSNYEGKKVVGALGITLEIE